MRLDLVPRLGVYQDGPFALVRDAGALLIAPDAVDAPFLRFAGAVAAHFDELVVFARVDEGRRGDDRLALPASTRVVKLPDYGSLRRLGAVARTAAATAAAFWRGLAAVDVVWAFGPHPFELLLVALAAVRRKRVVIGVRQDTPAYFRARLPPGRRRPLVTAIDALDGLHRLLVRRVPATVVGEANAARYGAPRRNVLMMTPTLVRDADVVPAPAEHDWGETVSLLTVGRVDAEKNPFLLIDAIAELERERPGRFRLTWVGSGPLEDAVRERATARGVAEAIELAGYVPFGPDLLALYRRAHAFVHVALTEGVPQVLVEAHASGIPVVATDVGSVRAAVEDGEAALLVPPSDLVALVAAIKRIEADADLRSRLALRGLEIARRRTLEAEAERVARFIGAS